MKLFVNILKGFVPYGIIWLYKKLTKPSKKKLKEQEISTNVRDLQLMVFDNNPIDCYGQFGEDLLLRIFSGYEEKKKGFYIDIGAYHPVTASNTKYFYDRGWQGINIDANPLCIAEFNKSRDRDINIEIGISDTEGEMDFHYFGDDQLINTFDSAQAERFEKIFDRPVKKVVKVPVKPINTILEEYLPKDQHIDFISLDVEGLELPILKSLDFDKYAPDYFLVEDLKTYSRQFRNLELEKLKETEQNQFLVGKGYKPMGKTKLTILYKRE